MRDTPSERYITGFGGNVFRKDTLKSNSRKEEAMKAYRIHIGKYCMFAVVATIIFLVNSPWSFGDTYPSKAISIFVGYGAGGQTDLSTRVVAQAMQKILGQPVMVINKPGASAAIMMEFVKNSSPDGYTLGAWASGAIAGTHIRNVPYHFFDDFTQICQITIFDMVLAVHADAEWKTARDLVEYGRKNPGQLRWGSSGIGGGAHMTSVRFGYQNGLDWEMVPFDGDAPAATALLGKHIDLVNQPLPACGALAQAGKLKLLGVFTLERVHSFPSVPTIKEQGLLPHEYKFGISGFCGPKKLPVSIEEKIASTVKLALQDPNVVGTLGSQYVHPTFRAGQDLIEYLKACDAEEVEVMKKIGLKIVRDAYK